MASTKQRQEQAKLLRKASNLKKKLEARQETVSAGFGAENPTSVYGVISHIAENTKTKQMCSGFYVPNKSDEHIDLLLHAVCNSFNDGSYMDANSVGAQNMGAAICDLMGRSERIAEGVAQKNNGVHYEFRTELDGRCSFRIAEILPADVLQKEMIKMATLLAADGHNAIIPD